MFFLLYFIVFLLFPFLCAWLFSVLKIKWQIIGYLITFLWAAIICPILFLGFTGLLVHEGAMGLLFFNLILGFPITLVLQIVAFAIFPIEPKNNEIDE
jgi:hypothetical protein